MRYLNACMAALAISLILAPVKNACSTEPEKNSSGISKNSSSVNPSQTSLEKQKTYEITGTTFKELIGQIMTVSKNSNLIVKWDIEWKYTTLDAPNMCGTKKITTTPKIHKPAQRLVWLDSALATEEMRTKWKHYIKALNDHNQGHMDIAKLAAYEIKMALGNMRANDCDQLKKDTDAKANEIIQHHRQQDVEYDRITGNDELHTGADVYLLK